MKGGSFAPEVENESGGVMVRRLIINYDLGEVDVIRTRGLQRGMFSNISSSSTQLAR